MQIENGEISDPESHLEQQGGVPNVVIARVRLAVAARAPLGGGHRAEELAALVDRRRRQAGADGHERR